MDLITLYKNPNFGFHKMAKQAIKAYVQKKPFLMAMPETIDITKKDFKSRYTIFIKLDKDIDKDIIEWLSDVKENFNNAAVKSIIRGSLIGVSAYGCLKNDMDRIESDKLNLKYANLSDMILSPIEKKVSKKKIKLNKKNFSKDIHKNILGLNEKDKTNDEKEMIISKRKDKEINNNKENSDIIDNNSNVKSEIKTEQISEDNKINVYDMDGFNLNGFSDIKPVEKKQEDDFDLFGDISQMMSNF